MIIAALSVHWPVLVAASVCCLLVLVALVFAARAAYRATTHIYGREYRELPKGQPAARLNIHPHPYERMYTDRIHGLMVTLMKVDGKSVRSGFSKVRTLLLSPGEHTLVFNVSFACQPLSRLEVASDRTVKSVTTFSLNFRDLSLTHTFKADEEYFLECRFVREDGEEYTPFQLWQSFEEPDGFIIAAQQAGSWPPRVNDDDTFSPRLTIKPMEDAY